MKLRIVEMDCPVETWEKQQTQQLFFETIKLKLDGYKSLYRDGVLAVGDSDFIATHKLICEERNGRLIPLIGNHTTTVWRARHHNLVFPALGLVKSAGASDHETALTDLIVNCDQKGLTLGYDAGFTMAPQARADRQMATELYDAFKAMKVFFLKESGIAECLTAATVRFKVERICAFWGYEPLKKEGVRLGQIPVLKMDGEKVEILHLRKISASAVEFAAQYKELWDNRIVLAANARKYEKIAA